MIFNSRIKIAPVIPNTRHDIVPSSETGRTKGFNIQYVDEEVLLNEAIVYQIEIDLFQVQFLKKQDLIQQRVCQILGFCIVNFYSQRKKIRHLKIYSLLVQPNLLFQSLSSRLFLHHCHSLIKADQRLYHLLKKQEFLMA